MAEAPYPAHAVWRPARSTAAHAGGLAYALLYVPSLVAALAAGSPVLSYALAWAGSWWILWLSMTGRIKPLPGGLPLRAQLMRPIGFTQAVFAGYMALTSIFFALDQLGFAPSGVASSPGSIPFDVVASAQRHYLLAHAAMVTGVLLGMSDHRTGKWRFVTQSTLSRTMLVLAVTTFVLVLVVRLLPGLRQLDVRLGTVSLVASVLALAYAVAERSPGTLATSSALYAVNMLQAFLSGWKEEILVMLILLGVFLYPYYRKLVLLMAPVAFGVFILVVPTYNEVFRELSWREGMDTRTAAAVALNAVATADAQAVKDNAWTFLTGRLSEINLFTTYLQRTPAELPFWGTGLVSQSVSMLVPRAFWPEKPNVERLVMQRVYDNGITTEDADVSAKPQYVVDGYLSYGALGVWLACLAYGLAAAWMSRLAEHWFGGYLIGSALVYSALFQILWRGNSFEFLIPNVFWSFIIMWGLFMLGRASGRLVRA